MATTPCKTCRRQRQKLFLKGDKCYSPKCLVIQRPFPPGAKKKRSRPSQSEFAKELFEKQKLKRHYGLSESQFRKYVKDVLQKRGKVDDATLLLMKKLESRLDNVIFRLGMARSRKEARELVSHSHFLVNKKPVNVASFEVKKGAVIALKDSKKQKPFFTNLVLGLKKYQPPAWLKLDADNLRGEFIAEPTLPENSNVDISSIFEFYSR